jgi:hypothetical protein
MIAEEERMRTVEWRRGHEEEKHEEHTHQQRIQRGPKIGELVCDQF